MINARLRRPVALVSAAGLILTLGAVSSSASADSPSSNLATALRNAPSGADMRASARTIDVDEDCFDDDEGDVQIASTGDANGDAIDEDAADILRHCVAHGPTLALSIDVEDARQPLTDPVFQDATFAGWFVDTDLDGDGEYFLEASLTEDGAAFRGASTDVSNPADPQPVCENITANATATGYSLSGIEAACLGDHTGPIAVAAAMYVDYDGPDSQDRAAFDAVPGGDGFDGPVQRDDDPRETDRLAGPNRDATSAVLSAFQFPGGADVVYLARNGAVDGNFADAVAGGVLTDGPILLVPTCGPVDPAVAREIGRLGATQVIALGGPVAICEDTLTEAAAGRTTSRVAGATRFDTAIAIADRVFPNGADSVYLARSDVFADAAVGGTVTDGPILLVPNCGDIPPAVLAEIDDQGPERVIAFGGPVAICEATFDAAGDTLAAGRTFRLAGETRVDTAIAISQHVFPQVSTTDDPVNVFLARFDVLADALVGGILTSGPILLTPSCGELPPAVGDEISRLSPERILALGGELAICGQLLTDASAL